MQEQVTITHGWSYNLGQSLSASEAVTNTNDYPILGSKKKKKKPLLLSNGGP
jgi:hypothetical protein